MQGVIFLCLYPSQASDSVHQYVASLQVKLGIRGNKGRYILVPPHHLVRNQIIWMNWYQETRGYFLELSRQSNQEPLILNQYTTAMPPPHLKKYINASVN